LASVATSNELLSSATGISEACELPNPDLSTPATLLADARTTNADATNFILNMTQPPTTHGKPA
jgi:hypothetical protein